MNPATRAYRPDIDGLRALAVIAVILNHLNDRLLPGGYLGVDIFFVISGFVITTSLRHRPAERLPQFLADFFARRCRRLVPALAVCVLISGLTAWFIDPKPAASLNTGLTALAGLSNFYLLRISQDYFAPAAVLNLFTQTWSLGVEEQFYLLFPLLVWICGLSRASQGSKNLFRACLGLSILSVVALLLLPGKDGGAAYFLVFGRLWELGCGCMAALAGPLKRRAWAWVGLATIVLTLAAPIPPSVLVSLCVVPPTVLLILSGGAPALLARRPVVAVGRMSYSLYLWHWPVVSASVLVFGDDRWHSLKLMAAILPLAAASYWLVERPARTKLASLPRRWSALSALAAVSIAGGTILGLKHWPNPAPFVERRFAEIPVANPSFPGTGADYMLDCVVDGKARPARPTTFDRCTVPPRPGVANTVWAMGDSHAGHLRGLLASLHDQSGLGVHLIETPGVTFPQQTGTHFTERDAFFAITLPKLHPGDTVLLGRIFLTREGPVTPLANLDSWLNAVEALATQLRPLGVQIVVVGPPPMFRFLTIFNCEATPEGITGCDIPRTTLATAIDPIEAAIRQAASRQPNLHLFSPFAVLCPPTERTCTPVRARVPQFQDQDHLNGAGAASLAPAFQQFLAELPRP